MNGLGSAARTGAFQQSEQVLSQLLCTTESGHLRGRIGLPQTANELNDLTQTFISSVRGKKRLQAKRANRYFKTLNEPLLCKVLFVLSGFPQ